ncbi:MAG: formyl-CoA transferase [Armatimonadetes bacterium RBG_16_67_12]|nr:MAG: formyl-CoA transferase [Armatimonadetes bacterium RBG_16_67_12]
MTTAQGGALAPLNDLLILDLTRALAGPYCTLMLADMGARVIKIETPDGGDDTRGWGPPFIQGESSYFLGINRNKESLTLNLKHPEAQDVLRRLIERADALVENFRPGVMDRFGFGYDAVHAMNPRLIYASVSGFGQDGPYRERVAYDLILQGMGGLMGTTGEEGGPPIKVGVAVTDIAAGMFAAYGVAVALHARARTGRGQLVDASMLDSQVAWMTYQAGYYFATGQNPRRLGTAHPSLVPYQSFSTSDGYVNVAVGSEGIWSRFAAAVGAPHLAEDARFRTNADRVRHRDALIALLEPIFAGRSMAEWSAVLESAGVPAGPIYLLSDLFNDPQVRHRQMVVDVEHPKAGRIRQTGVPLKLSDTPGRIALPPPLLGQHSEGILRELGYGADEIAALRGHGTI